MGNYGPLGAKGGEYEKICPTCNRKFYTNYERQVYCSNRCKRRLQNRRHYERKQTLHALLRATDRLTNYGQNDPGA